jgi:hypothetical protein
MKARLFAAFASTVQARANCAELDHTGARMKNPTWFDKHSEKLNTWAKQHLPSGSGFDSGTTLDKDKSTGAKLVFNTAFHHMNEGGYYDGWTHHSVVVTPTFDGVFVRVTGVNRNDIKDHIAEQFHYLYSIELEY